MDEQPPETQWIMSAFYFFLLFTTSSLPIISSLHIEIAETRIRSNKTETDRLALLAFKSKITIDPFHVLRSWNDSHSFCRWQGVTCCSRRRRVIKLYLGSQNLVGSLSPHVGNLTFIRGLYLHNNSFHDEIPPEVGRLFSLRALSLHNNSFVGSIPANISGCTALRDLVLSHNKLVGKIPIELGSLSKLKILHLHDNYLIGGIPSFLGNFSSVQQLSLGRNSLGAHIPNSLCRLKSLHWFVCGSCRLSGTVPSFLYNISSLTHLVLSDNQLSGSLPPNIGLPNLQCFEIGLNQFSGTIPVSLFNASRLQILDMVKNNFFGKVPVKVGNLKALVDFKIYSNHFGSGKMDDLDFLPTLTNCSHLKELAIGCNHFGGVLPNSITNLSNQLTILEVGRNRLHGKIPHGIHKFVNLIALTMSDNFFTGSIPSSIGMLQKVQKVELGANRLSGQLPPSVGNMSSLYFLNLSSNMLQGKIIWELTECRFLQELYLSNNKLDGPIPKKLAGLSSQLRFLDLAHNSLIGSLPIQLGSFTHLQTLDVSENKMSGEIPSTIGGCRSLRVVSLKGNFFRGPIPTSFKSLNDLHNLDLSMNSLSGEIPKGLGYLPLENLNLSFNNLKGSVPTEGVFKNGSVFSVLGNQKLCGGIVELQLPACHTQNLKKKKMSLTLKVILGIVVIGGLASSLFVAFHWKRRKAMPSFEAIPVDHFKRVSYHELHRATDGFSSTNLIGIGSFGSVYKGILQEDEGLIAVKVLDLIEQGANKSFIVECDALRKIRHRNLLKILTICSSVDFKGNDFKALVLKYMPNGNLEAWLHPSLDGGSRTLSLFQRLNIAIDIALALDYLHNQCGTCIIHCDIKPSNILLDEDMTAHVSDFGLAKFLPRNINNFNACESSSASPRGTVGYIPPEYGIGREVSAQGDVYSYGILLLELLTGKRPTDDTFKDGLTLHNFCSMALPLRIMDIVAPQMPLEEHHDIINSTYQRDRTNRIRECIASIVKVGVACSVESQRDRLGINDVLMELHVIKQVFWG